MKITKIEVYQVDLPLVDGSYEWADGKSVEVYDSTVVAVHTDGVDGAGAAVVGFGEVVPLGPNYLPSYAAGARAGLRQVAPHLLGADATRIGVANDLMDFHLKGHPYVKSPVDAALWDALGKRAGMPVSALLGGAHQDSVRLYRAIPQRKPQDMVDLMLKYKRQGYTRFQLKLGGNANEDMERLRQCRRHLSDPADVLLGDANTGWTSNDAIRVANHVRDLDVYIEQPCRTIQECKRVRQHTNLPFVMDESVHDVGSLLEVCNEGMADVVNIKISKFGGITKAKQAVDLCVSFGLPMIVEDSWGGDFATAAIAHLASSVPKKFQFASTDFNSYNTVKTGTIIGGDKSEGYMKVPTGPGLGVEPNWEALGKPVFSFPS